MNCSYEYYTKKGNKLKPFNSKLLESTYYGKFFKQYKWSSLSKVVTNIAEGKNPIRNLRNFLYKTKETNIEKQESSK